jgi:hypothetical protein
MTAKRVDAFAASCGLTINGHVFDAKLPFARYQGVLGLPSRTIDAGPPPPVGHRNNQVHVFDFEGIYLTEHHSSGLIESVNFVFDPVDSPFPIGAAFGGNLDVDGQLIRVGTMEQDIDSGLTRDLPGEYSVKHTNCWIGVSAKGRRDSLGKRRKPRYVVRVSICF